MSFRKRVERGITVLDRQCSSGKYDPATAWNVLDYQETNKNLCSSLIDLVLVGQDDICARPAGSLLNQHRVKRRKSTHCAILEARTMAIQSDVSISEHHHPSCGIFCPVAPFDKDPGDDQSRHNLKRV